MTSGGWGGAELSRAWALLGVRANPCPEDVRAAFCARAVVTHPDRCSDPGAKERFQSLHAAYEIALGRSQQDKAAGGARGRGVEDYDWRAETARVRTAYSAMLNHFDELNPRTRPARRRCGASASVSVSIPSPATAAPRPKAPPAGSRGAKRAATTTELRRTAAEQWRLRQRSDRALQRLLRAAVAEAARRQAVVFQEQWEWRGMAMGLAEVRIRHTVQVLEEVAREALYSMFDVDLSAWESEAPRTVEVRKRKGGVRIPEVAKTRYLARR